MAIAQDRIREKSHFVGCGVDCAPYAIIESTEHMAVPPNLLPGILKTARLGYDGKGQQRVDTRDELAAAWRAMGGVPCVLEKLLPLDFECSVIVARGADGQIVHFPPQRNLHRDGILAVTEVHADNMPEAPAQRAVDSAVAIAEGLDYVGVLCVEFFVLADGSLVVNEMAPRPHNSGHWTMEACDISQFELQVRTLAGLPLNAPRQHSPAHHAEPAGRPVVRRHRGLGRTSVRDAVEPRWADVLALPGTHLHLYGKTEARRGRKMGHLTITGENIDTRSQHRRLRRRAARPADPAVRMIRDGRAPDAIDEAARVLRAGGLVAFPTETVYGLGADATSDAAVAGIFSAKGRPSNHPLIVHVAAGVKGTEALSRFAQPLPPFAQKLVLAFWPGPLTLIVTRQPGVAAAAAGGQDTIGLRCPAHPVAQALLARLRRAGRARRRGAERKPLRPREPDHRAACAGGVRRRAAGDRRRPLRGGHRIDHRRLQPRRAGAAAARRDHARADRGRLRRGRCATSTNWPRPIRAPPARSKRTTRRAPSCA